MKTFSAALTVLSVFISLGCDGGDTSSYTPSSHPSGYSGVDYDSGEFKSADPKVKEYIINYDILRKNVYSDEDSKNAVIDTINH